MEGTESKCRRRRKSAARPFVRSQEEVCDRRTSIDSSCRAATFRNFYEQEELRPLDARTKVVTHFQEAIIEESTLSSDSEPETTTRFPFPRGPRLSYCIFLVKLFRRSIVRYRLSKGRFRIDRFCLSTLSTRLSLTSAWVD